MVTIKKINEEQLCEDYLNESIGTDKLAERYHIGKKRVREILASHGIERKKRGGQNLNVEYKVPDWRIVKYPEVDGKHYIAVDRNTGLVTLDVNNRAGFLTTHIEKVYGIETPTLYDRRQYYMKTGNYWWEQWFDICLVDDAQVKKCPYCDWTTVDVENKSGMFETHLNKVHNKSKLEYLEEHPEDLNYFSTVNQQVSRQMEKNEYNFVVCKVCGKKLARIDNHHLKRHGMTKLQYMSIYGSTNLSSQMYHKKQSEKAIEANMNMIPKFHSNPELEIIEFLKNNGVECRTDRRILMGKEIDIYMPSLKIGIEYNGNMWHTEYFGNKDKHYHLKKLQMCEVNGVKLLSIFEDEFKLNRDIVFSKISHIVGVGNESKRKIYGRKCVIKKISKIASNEFLDRNHIQGGASATVYLGAYYEGELIAVMCFVKRQEEWELIRFASDNNSICCGVGGKLFKYFIRNYDFNIIKSFADRRWTSSLGENVYTKLGFELDGFVGPSYTYYNKDVDRYKRFHKFGFRKQILLKKYPDLLNGNMTEKEMTQKLGYDRIWDCGLIKYVYKKKEKIINE